MRRCSAYGPRCFKCLMLMLSGPVELFVLDVLIAVLTCSVDKCIGSVCSFRIFLSIILFCLFVLCCVWFVNCLLKYCAFCLFVTAVC